MKFVGPTRELNVRAVKCSRIKWIEPNAGSVSRPSSKLAPDTSLELGNVLMG
jgi:hypothetical protein